MLSAYESATAVKVLVIAGPDVTTATPTLLLDLEYPAALNAADCSLELTTIVMLL